MTVNSSRPRGSKAAQNHNAPSSVLHLWDDGFIDHDVGMQCPFYTILSAACSSHTSQPSFHRPTNHFLVLLWTVMLPFGKPLMHSVVGIAEQHLPPWCSAMDTVLCAAMHHYLYMGDSSTEMVTSSNDFFKPLAVTLGFFFNSVNILHCAFGVILARCLILGRVTTEDLFFHL